MTTPITLAGNLPADNDYNGVPDMASELIEDPLAIHYAVVAFDAAKITRKTDTGEVTPTIRIRRIEPVAADSDEANAVKQLLQDVSSARLGALPFDEVADEPTEDE